MTLFISNSNPKYPSLHSYIKIKLKRNLFLSPKKKKNCYFTKGTNTIKETTHYLKH